MLNSLKMYQINFEVANFIPIGRIEVDQKYSFGVFRGIHEFFRGIICISFVFTDTESISVNSFSGQNNSNTSITLPLLVINGISQRGVNYGNSGILFELEKIIVCPLPNAFETLLDDICCSSIAV